MQPSLTGSRRRTGVATAHLPESVDFASISAICSSWQPSLVTCWLEALMYVSCDAEPGRIDLNLSSSPR